MTKFLFIVFIALANLCVGFATAMVMGLGPTFRFPRLHVPRKSPKMPSPEQPVPAILDVATPSAEPVEAAPEKEEADCVTDAQSARDLAARIDALLENSSQTLESIQAKLKSDEIGAGQIESLASNVDGVAQQLLKRINTTMDELRKIPTETDDEGPDPEMLLLHLDAAWGDFNDQAVQLVTFSFDNDSIESTTTQLDDVLASLQSTCNEVRISIGA